MTSLAGRVLETVRRRQLCAPGTRVVAAVSGGADSVALVHLLAELSACGALELAGIAHLNHRLRGAESDRDARFCARLAADFALPFDVEECEVAVLAARAGRSIEDAARVARYRFLERARQRLDAELVAVGHTKDDQAETVLMRLLRGSGTQGLGGIHPRKGRLIRPLIDLRRQQLVEYLGNRNIGWVEDSTNADRAMFRNRVRHDLLPYIEGIAGADVTNVLARTAEVSRADDALLEALGREAAARVATGPGEVDVAALQAEPPALQRRVIRHLLTATQKRRPTLAHVESVLRLAGGANAGAVRLPDCRVELSPDRRVLRFSAGDAHAPLLQTGWHHELPVPGVVDVPEAGLRMNAERREAEDEMVRSALKRTAAASAVVDGAFPGPVVVRGWLPGDRLQPLGCSGRKKVQDLFVDRKVPRCDRYRVPIIAARDGRIVWVVGHALAEEFRVTSATKSVVVLSFEPLGGL